MAVQARSPTHGSVRRAVFPLVGDIRTFDERMTGHALGVESVVIMGIRTALVSWTATQCRRFSSWLPSSLDPERDLTCGPPRSRPGHQNS